ncbi:hypothetical protein H696_02012 [Fonticula alba]|uniref:Uncharacterized protein n=1 Tax=Fonticula alba TaxID=691883 RepID=A0A058ZC98_FONAL|nr:hypothetical protein H696_02012 [Fonticula alba]KCV71062.1 hypothetical protein H696_02012 [Fonticula alba]|eukprot:XP_009494185.1 hypothetical protein H696_02012 [Fonticula alba]
MLKQSREFGNSPGKALQRLVPFFSLTAFSLVFMHYGATGGVFQGVLVKRHMLAFTFAFGFDFSQLVARVILAHLTRSPKSYPGGILSHIGSLIPITGAVGALFGLFGGTPEADDRAVQWLYIWLALSTLHYAFMVWAVINQICNFLGVGCLRIVRRPSGNYHRRSQQRMAAAAAAASASSSSVASAGSTVFPPASRLDSRRAHA